MSNGDGSISSIFTRSKEYQSPRLWYVRVNVIEVQDLVLSEKDRVPDVCVRCQINYQVLKTKQVQSTIGRASWNEDLMFVAAEPFEDQLVLTVEDHVGPDEDEKLGMVVIPLKTVDRRADDRMIQPRWYNLQEPLGRTSEGKEKKKKDHKFATRIHLRVCLDGGYHVLDESTQYSSDLRPSAEQLWRPSVGIIELGILNATGIQPMKTRHGKGTADAYCVAKYGHKWVRTRTVIDSLVPKFNEQYKWEVYDLSTVLTVGVFDNSLEPKYSKDQRIGKIRIRLSTLETVAARLSRAEPPLRKEIVEYMTDADPNPWSMRHTKANFFRVMSLLSGMLAVSKWFGEVCLWRNPITTVLVHILFVMLVTFPELIALHMVFLYMFLIGLWNYWFRAQYPPHIDTRLSYVDGVSPNELDEEFDTFPTSKYQDIVRHRYDNLRSVAGKIQIVLGDIASQGERLQGLLSWRDPRATVIFMVFCLVAAFVLYMTPSQVLVTLGGFYVMRHPRLRHRLPSAPLNFFRRLPARTDSML
ncbi:FT-interacting protein 1 [Tanacetum coccineum]